MKHSLLIIGSTAAVASIVAFSVIREPAALRERLLPLSEAVAVPSPVTVGSSSGPTLNSDVNRADSQSTARSKDRPREPQTFATLNPQPRVEQRVFAARNGGSRQQTASSRPSAQSVGTVVRGGLPDANPTPTNAPPTLPPELMLDLGPGVAKPAALLESDMVLTPQQAAAKNKIAEDFIQEISAVAPKSGDGVAPAPNGEAAQNSPSLDEVYFDAAARANSRYRLLFGDEAMDRAEIRAKIESGAGLTPPDPSIKP